MTDRIAIRRALISVSDKTGLEDLGKALAAKGVDLLSTGGTATALRGAGLEVRDVAEVTGSPEMMDGRVKTLHPRIHGGLLARRDLSDHMEALETHGIPAIDLLVVNLYPFEATIRKGAGWEEAVENVDIGGPAMIRAAAKNHASVTVIVDPADYAGLLGEIEADGATSEAFRIRAAQTAFARTAAYDAAVSGWMARAAGIEERPYAAIGGAHVQSMRYGENPHQKAAYYADGSGTGLAAAEQVQGKALSYNNINDTDAALELVAEFDGPACAIIKHANPCGVAAAAGLADAYQAAYDCDRTSAFGGIVAFNREIDAETAKAVTSIFTEVVIAPAASAEAREVFAAKNNLRLLIVPEMPDPARTGEVWRQVGGGYLVQDRDGARFDRSRARVVTKREPTEAEWADLAHAWTVAKHVKSNAIVYAKDGATVGVGAGQMSRLDSTLVASRKAREMAEVLGLPTPLTEGAALASDAFFPFPDGLLAAAEAGAKAVIQPGGAMRDDDVIAAADEAGLAMVFTGIRHFRH